MRKLVLMLICSGFLLAHVGHFVIVRGDVSVLRGSDILRATSGMPIHNQDQITTKGAAKAQIKFNDDTVVSLGKNTTFRVNDYLDTNNGKKLHMGVDKGSFKVITGAIAKTSRDNFVFKANSVTIGVRGTIFAGEVGQKHKQDTIACVQGAIDVKLGGNSQRIIAGKMIEVVGGKLGDVKALDSSKIETINTIKSAAAKSRHIDTDRQSAINAKKSNNSNTHKPSISREYASDLMDDANLHKNTSYHNGASKPDYSSRAQERTEYMINQQRARNDFYNRRKNQLQYDNVVNGSNTNQGSNYNGGFGGGKAVLLQSQIDN